MSKMKIRIATGMLTSVLLCGNAFANNEPITVTADPHIEPLLSALISEKGLDLPISTSTNVPNILINGYSSIGITASRWSDKDIAQFKARFGERPTELYFAIDYATLLVSSEQESPTLSASQLRSLLQCEKQLELAVDYTLYQVAQQYSPLFPRLECQQDQPLPIIDESQIESTLDANPNALFVSFKQNQSQQLQQVQFVDDDGNPVDFEARSFISGDYPLASVYYLYADHKLLRDDTLTAVADFIDFTLQESNNSLFDDNGFLPLPQQMIHRNKVQLEIEQPQFEQGYK